ncbi:PLASMODESMATA CALLOSE-BINDING PROTEIN 3-like isoform X2 [Tripterygium wilfordii]|uniref:PLASMODESMATA CALLOSE-BINDING PROTEIN 3-like isoform X2 n=1 Tax=Tripterygium wilfordii TaxID=458696 RepID=UPI0018F824FF|nr:PLASMODESMATA CALLOSE-BINDING PROTEIN 3-like isoform X2 [Tripterygium wilfordii]
MAVLVFLVLLLSLTGHSSATYCLCKDGVGDQSLQKAIDYACGAGADCTPILQNGPCYQPNTVKDHCNYAVNSYYQRKGQATGSCDFSGTATVSANPPTTAASGCAYPSSPRIAATTPGQALQHQPPLQPLMVPQHQQQAEAQLHQPEAQLQLLQCLDLDLPLAPASLILMVAQLASQPLTCCTFL